jgi:hypothetical protein
MTHLPKYSARSLLISSCTFALVLPAGAGAAILGSDEFSRLDTNKDGLVSAAENAAGAKAAFRLADANRDDVLTVTELAIAEEKRGDREAISARKSVSAELRAAAEQIKAVDQNGDGEASAPELAASALQIFTILDVNHDGYLDPAECEAGR